MVKEVCCTGVTANPRFDVQKCCVVACKRNHFEVLNLCKPLQNTEMLAAIYAAMVLYVGCSKEPSH